MHRVRVYRVSLAHDKKQNSISLPSFPPCFLSPQMALHALGGGFEVEEGAGRYSTSGAEVNWKACCTVIQRMQSKHA